MKKLEKRNWPKDPRYEVTSDGQVIGLKGRPLTPRLNGEGYGRVSIQVEPGVYRDEYIHRIVCETYHGESPFEGAEVDHKNKRRGDNRAANLRWVTVTENRSHREIAKGEDHPFSKLSKSDVLRFRRERAAGKSFYQMSRETGFNRRTIADAVTGQTWSHI